MARVEKGNIETLISATSQVGDTDQVDIISSVSGEAIKVAVSEGQEVKKGDLIVQIDASDLNDEIYQVQLAAQSAELNLKKIKEPVSEYDIKKAENEWQVAKNSLSELKLTQKNELSTVKEEKAVAQDNLEKLAEDVPDYETKKATYQSQISAIDRKIGEYNLSHPLKISEAEARIKEMEKALEKYPSDPFIKPQPMETDVPVLKGEVDWENPHSILYHIENQPSLNPQYQNWEAGIQNWLQSK